MKDNLFNAPDFPLNAGKSDWPWLPVQPLYTDSISPTGLPRITVVTPSFNQGQFIEEAIRSVLLQDYPNLELIIIDGGSTDNTIEIIKKYEPWLAYWVSESDLGQSHALNKGFKRATGDIFAWLNSDDIYLPGALFQIANEFIRNKTDWMVGITVVSDENLNRMNDFIPQINTGQWKIPDYRSKGWLDFVMTHQSGTALPQPSSFWSRKVIEEVGFIDESFYYAMDHDLTGRIAHLGYRPKLLPHTLAAFRNHPQQKTSASRFLFWQEEFVSVKKRLKENLNPDEAQTLSKYATWLFWQIREEEMNSIFKLRSVFNFLGNLVPKIKKLLGLLKRSIFQDHTTTLPSKGIISKEIIAKYLPKKPIIVEAGAHLGFDTVQLAQYFPDGEVHAFEPVPELFLQLSERVRHYKNVHCYPYALSQQTGYAMMYVSSGISDASSSLLPPKTHLDDHPEVLFNTTIIVTCITLDDWAKNNNIENVDLLWLDMQGHELSAVKAGQELLKNVQAIYTEVNLKEGYEGAPLYGEYKEWLGEHKFEVELEEIPWEDAGNVLFVRKPAS